MMSAADRIVEATLFPWDFGYNDKGNPETLEELSHGITQHARNAL